MRRLIAVAAAIAGPAMADGMADAERARAVRLLIDHKCYICHADTETKAGPAYVDVSVRYKGKSDAMRVVATIIRTGERTGGPWHMPPHPEVSRAEAETMARYILSLK